MVRTIWTRVVLVVIMGALLLTLPACGKKGDPIPPRPQQPKADTNAQQPEKPADVTPTK